jgi:hypothetical protein
MTSLSVFFARTFGSILVPHDQMYDQAKTMIAEHDVDGDGVINLNDEAQRQSLNPLFGKGFRYADKLGWNNGVVSLRELRNGMKRYDTEGGIPAGPNGAIQGSEWINILRDVGAYG